jgi:hypothetical protein
MKFKMAKQREPTEMELEEYNELCSLALTRRAGRNVKVALSPFSLPTYVTKSYIFGADVSVVSEGEKGRGGSAQIPSRVIVKRYIPGIKGTSDKEDRTREEFRREKAVLEYFQTSREEEKIFPEWYSCRVSECDEKMVIIREFIEEENLEQIASRQEKEEGIKWEATKGTPTISDALFPISLLHVQSPELANALKEKDLLKFGTPSEANPEEISKDRAERFVRYIDVLVRGKGNSLDEYEKRTLFDSFFRVDKEVVSRKELLSMVHGELDVFPHHAMLTRNPDAGSVEVGGLVRDLAVYSAPAFNSLFKNPEKMLETVRPTYVYLRNQNAERLDYSVLELNNDILDSGIIYSSFFGNYRKSAAVVHYNGKDYGYPVDEETTRYLRNGLRYFEYFMENNKDFSEDNKKIYDILTKYNLGNYDYQIFYKILEEDKRNSSNRNLRSIRRSDIQKKTQA